RDKLVTGVQTCALPICLASFWLDVHVSEGTNTKDEKAAYLAALFQRMGELLGPLHEESYAHVDEVKGDAYGFGGFTQERRYIARSEERRVGNEGRTRW